MTLKVSTATGTVYAVAPFP